MPRRNSSRTRAPRVDLRRAAILVNSDGVTAPVTILDVSKGGFRLDAEEPPREGELVTLRVERGMEFPAQVQWVLGREAGGRFIDDAGGLPLGLSRGDGRGGARRRPPVLRS